jgi:hypothetical protein
MSLMLSKTLNKNNSRETITAEQKKKNLKLKWSTIPEGGRILLHYKNGTYIGIERGTGTNNGEIEIIYTGRITSSENGEVLFGSLPDKKERNITKYEYALKE